MACWLLKTESGEFSFDDLVRRKRATWDGVSNALALKHMAAARTGDLAFIYHTGDEKQIVGIAEIASNPRKDPKADRDRVVVFDLVPKRKFKQPVTLAAIKSDKRFADFPLVKIGRLSVMPVTAAQGKAILAMGGAE